MLRSPLDRNACIFPRSSRFDSVYGAFGTRSAMSDPRDAPKLEIRVIGGCRVVADDGKELTPRGQKARALLGILALTPARRRSRSALQDKLWSDRGPEQGAASLRQTLTEIRRAFGDRYRDCLLSDLRSVGLAAERVLVDLDATSTADLARTVEVPRLLDDLDIADDEFEHWLRNQRSAFEERIIAFKSATPARPSVPEPSPLPRHSPAVVRPWIRLLPPLTISGESGTFLSRLLGDRITQGLADQWGIDISDDGKGSRGVQLRVDTLQTSRDITVNVILIAADGRTQMWSGFDTISLGEGFISDAPRLHVLINRSIDAAGHYLSRTSSSADQANAFTHAFGGVQRMFKIDLEEVDRADEMLGTAYELDSKAIYLAWRAYARTFYVGEHMLADRRQAVEEADELVRHALEADPHNATVLALASYVFSFAFRNYAAGHELAEQSIKCNATHPLGHAFLGRAKSYLGEHDAGYLAACRGRDLSGQAPYRYKLHFLCGVTALLSGRFSEAVRAAEIASTMAPGYRPPQRYLVPLYLHLGERDKARDAIEKLRLIEPSFSLDAMRETSYPSTAVREARLLNFTDRDL
jgi:tetratricopeptide (TPR) repeat protein